MASPTISANIIVRNAERTIERCLNSIQKVVDEIVIVDTGSTDQTLELLKKYHVKLIQTNWNDSFSEARNVAKSHSSSEWILTIDADEYLANQEPPLREMLVSTCEAGWITVKNFLSDDFLHSNQQRALRLFKNNELYSFSGRIHEQILPSILQQHHKVEVLEIPLEIHHTGYLQSEVLTHQKSLRNLSLLKKELSEQQYPFHHYNIAVEYVRMNEHEQALEHLITCFQLEKEAASYLSSATYLKAVILLVLKRYKEAQDWLLTSLDRYKDYADLYYLLGEAYMKQHYYEQAANAYLTATKQNVNNQYMTNEGTNSFGAYYKIGRCFQQTKRFKDALLHFLPVISLRPNDREAYLRTAECLHALDIPVHQIKGYFEDVMTHHHGQPLLIVHALFHIGVYQLTKPFIEMINEKQLTASLQNEVYMNERLLSDAITIQKSLLRDLPEAEQLPIIRDHCLAFLIEGVRLPQFLKRHLHTTFPQLYEVIYEKKLNEEACQLIDRALSLHYPELINYFASIHSSTDALLFYGKQLFKHGYLNRAADYFISLLEQQSLSTEVATYLGEILYHKNHLEEAISLLESVDESALTDSLRLLLSACYLKEAKQWLVRLLEERPNERLQLHLHDTEKSLHRIELSLSSAAWTVKQRRNGEK
ncbi:glycosyltransferase [Bacillus sp. CGMCC 1.16541]|uniref:glycosyltransferase n=1 Tax=Bacillus sp. CGMCC 1.16541 TaxID=2185143 RepID=UPI0013A57496|nr:glycosyltransferase [Bacillus sp. CGMCC 1.16541]